MSNKILIHSPISSVYVHSLGGSDNTFAVYVEAEDRFEACFFVDKEKMEAVAEALQKGSALVKDYALCNRCGK